MTSRKTFLCEQLPKCDRFERGVVVEAWQNSMTSPLQSSPGSAVNLDIEVQVGCQT